MLTSHLSRPITLFVIAAALGVTSTFAFPATSEQADVREWTAAKFLGAVPAESRQGLWCAKTSSGLRRNPVKSIFVM
jgi:hypothetical protein